MNSLFYNLFVNDVRNIFDSLSRDKYSKSVPGFLLKENQYEFTTKLFAGSELKDITAEIKDQYLHIYNKIENETKYSYIIVTVPSDLNVKSIVPTYKNGVLKITAKPDTDKTTTLTITE